MEVIFQIGSIVAVIVVSLLTIGMIFSKLYKKATKEESFVRTGLGGEKVILNGGAIVLPVLHDIITINMRTLKLEVRRANEAALITRDRMRVDVTAEFYVRVAPTKESISIAAQTLGKRTMDPNALKELIEGKFVDVLRSVAAEMAMEQLHEKRADFVQLVQNNVRVDLEKNGLELETVSLTSLDQTDPSFFRPENAFDAEGLMQLTKITESRRKLRNDIERDTAVEIEKKNLEAEQQQLEIVKEEEYAKLQQQREIEVRKADQESEISIRRAEKKREADEVEIEAKRKVDMARIIAEKDVEEESINKQRFIQEREIEKAKAIEEANIEKRKAVELAEQVKAIAIAEKSKEESVAEADANKAKADAVKEEEQVITVRETAKADREKEIQLIEARRVAEKEAISITVAAEAEKKAAEDNAESVRIQAGAEAEAEKIKAEANRVHYEVEAEGKRAIHEAENVLSTEQIAMHLKLALLKQLPSILSEAVKPMENIEGIKIFQIDGLTGSSAGGGQTIEGGQSSGNLADQVVNAALRYKAQSPLVDSLLAELGMDGKDINGLVNSAIDLKEVDALDSTSTKVASGKNPAEKKTEVKKREHVKEKTENS